MMRVMIEHARPGMPVALPVHHPGAPGRVLLHSGAKLTDRAIERLTGQGVQEIWIAWPGLEFIREHVNPQLVQAHRVLTKQLGVAFDAVADDAAAEADYATLKHSIGDFLEKLLENPRSTAFISEFTVTDSPILRHCSGVCLMSLMIGLKLGGYLIRQRRRLPPKDAMNIVNLGVGAMLHDIGLLRISDAAVRRFNQTHDETDAEWREHVQIGHRIVSGKVDPTASNAVLHHHQRFDGTGFPEHADADAISGPAGRAGEEIHVFARIIAAADLFDRLRYNGQEKPVRTRVAALKAMRDSEHSGRLDPVIVDGLLAVTPPYPIGSVVRLTSGDNAVVTKWSPAAPCRPVVRLIGELDEPPEDDCEFVTLHLENEPEMAIAQAEGADVLHDNFTVSATDAARAA